MRQPSFSELLNVLGIMILFFVMIAVLYGATL